ncbi:cupin domain-containing protein [Mucilaginibacter limnophilus]|uniref:Cupin domain-containing protein n=1 Tax=Mucilaginibacter limnophilus TaxID=1932778 RepID=A0A3S2Y1M1_9SPHI|nr:cupin domain-containing protein [Mucilaginibacter limnophilus]RVT98469.1 cupin domain-containing protein [Mucilaginibacter limnophilus]
MENTVRILDKNDGRRLGVVGGNYRVIVDGKDTDGAYAVIEMLVPPGGGPPPHSHPLTQETFYVLAGEVTFKTEAGHQVVQQGGFVVIPFGGAIHCFQNTSGATACLLCTVMPAGLEEVFQAIGTPVAPGEFLPVPELTPDRKALLQRLDEAHQQQTYPRDYLDLKE